MTAGPAVSTADRTFEPLFPQKKADDLSTYAYRQLIGSIGLVYPVVRWLIAGLRRTPGLAQLR